MIDREKGLVKTHRISLKSEVMAPALSNLSEEEAGGKEEAGEREKEDMEKNRKDWTSREPEAMAPAWPN